MRLDRVRQKLSVFERPAASVTASLMACCTVSAGLLVGSVHADPANDALATLNELSRQAEQTTEAMHSAQLDLDEKVAAQQAADQAHIGNQATLDAANDRLASFRSAVNRFAVTTYMGGRTQGMDAFLTAGSPQQLIDMLAVQRVVSADLSVQMDRYRAAREQADQAEQASAKSAADAKTAAEQAAAVRADLQAKQSQLQLQIAVVKSQYFSLTARQREELAAPAPAKAPAPEAAPGVPTPDALPPAGGPDAPAPAPDMMLAAPWGGGDAAAVAVRAAMTQIGTPYAWGGAAPGGFDCSGLVMWAFHQAGIALPHSSQALAHGGQAVGLSDLQPGDVLTFYSDASHAGIYVGDGMMIHSPTFGQPVRVVPMTESGPIYNARRY